MVTSIVSDEGMWWGEEEMEVGRGGLVFGRVEGAWWGGGEEEEGKGRGGRGGLVFGRMEGEWGEEGEGCLD